MQKLGKLCLGLSKKFPKKSSIMFLSVAAVSVYTVTVLATDIKPTDIQSLAGNITKTFKSLGQLMIATSYLAGIGFSIAAIFKFKQHKDNPTQIPIGTPLAMLVIGVVLIFMPMIIKPIGTSIFGTGGTAGGFKGGGAGQLPGGSS